MISRRGRTCHDLGYRSDTGEARFADAFRAAEDVVKGCDLDWTVLRCADFAANALAWAPQIRQGGEAIGVQLSFQEISPQQVHATAVQN